jgi:hypothetical protein
MATAYPYDVELKITNENTKDVQLVKRRVFAYNAVDACTQAMIVAGAGSSAKVDVVSIGPPEECFAKDALQLIADAIGARTKKVAGRAY